MKRKYWLGLIGVVLVFAGWAILHSSRTDSTTSVTHSTDTTTPQTQPQTVSFDKTRYSVTDPSSIWVIVNKPNPIEPLDYVPSDLVLPTVSQRVPGTEQMKMRKAAAKALEAMFAGAKTQNLSLQITTAYRGYAYQSALYNGYVKSSGQATADKTSARPGHSEHQTGLAADIRPTSGKCYLQACFGKTPEGKWLAANSYKYGYILRYPEDKESVTGYQYEPWHFRYVGTYLSNELHRTSTETLEEFFDVGGGTAYN